VILNLNVLCEIRLKDDESEKMGRNVNIKIKDEKRNLLPLYNNLNSKDPIIKT